MTEEYHYIRTRDDCTKIVNWLNENFSIKEEDGIEGVYLVLGYSLGEGIGVPKVTLISHLKPAYENSFTDIHLFDANLPENLIKGLETRISI